MVILDDPFNSVEIDSWDGLLKALHSDKLFPLVAAHFATGDLERYEKDGVIWCVDVYKIHQKPQELGRILEEKNAFLYYTALLDDLFNTLEAFDKRFKGDHMIFFEPPSIDARIQNQRGILSVMNGAAKSHQEYLKANTDAVQRIVINAKAKPKIRDLLDQSNITERVLFPGLPGLCQWLKRYYGPTVRKER